MRIICGVGDIFSSEAIVDNHICKGLCDANVNSINRIVRNVTGPWYAVNFENKVILPDIKGCPYCLRKLSRRAVMIHAEAIKIQEEFCKKYFSFAGAIGLIEKDLGKWIIRVVLSPSSKNAKLPKKFKKLDVVVVIGQNEIRPLKS